MAHDAERAAAHTAEREALRGTEAAGAAAATANKHSSAVLETTVNGVSADASGMKVDNKLGGSLVQNSVTGVSAEANAVKVENKVGGAGLPAGGGSNGASVAAKPTSWVDTVLGLIIVLGGAAIFALPVVMFTVRLVRRTART